MLNQAMLSRLFAKMTSPVNRSIIGWSSVVSAGKLLIAKYLQGQTFVNSDIESFNCLITKELQRIVDENKEIEPTIIPHDIDEFKIRLDKIWVTKPEITEGDGSKRRIFPNEARLRKISYHAPIFLEVSSYVNDVQRENFVAEIG